MELSLDLLIETNTHSLVFGSVVLRCVSSCALQSWITSCLLCF